MQREDGVEGANRDQVLTAVKDPPSDSYPLRAGEHLVQEPVSGRALGACAQVVGALVVDGVDLEDADEFFELDQMRSLAGRRIDLLLAQDDLVFPNGGT